MMMYQELEKDLWDSDKCYFWVSETLKCSVRKTIGEDIGYLIGESTLASFDKL